MSFQCSPSLIFCFPSLYILTLEWYIFYLELYAPFFFFFFYFILWFCFLGTLKYFINFIHLELRGGVDFSLGLFIIFFLPLFYFSVLFIVEFCLSWAIFFLALFPTVYIGLEVVYLYVMFYAAFFFFYFSLWLYIFLECWILLLLCNRSFIFSIDIYRILGIYFIMYFYIIFTSILYSCIYLNV